MCANSSPLGLCRFQFETTFEIVQFRTDTNYSRNAKKLTQKKCLGADRQLSYFKIVKFLQLKKTGTIMKRRIALGILRDCAALLLVACANRSPNSQSDTMSSNGYGYGGYGYGHGAYGYGYNHTGYGYGYGRGAYGYGYNHIGYGYGYGHSGYGTSIQRNWFDDIVNTNNTKSVPQISANETIAVGKNKYFSTDFFEKFKI